MLTPFRAIPVPHERVWGGIRLGPPGDLPIGELWVVGPWMDVADGARAGRTLDDVARELGAALVGSAAPVRPGPRFPLLLKLIDPAAWLSVQVHPDDDLARRLAGPDAVGKTEAWYVIEADPGAELLAGTRADASPDAVRDAIRQGSATTRLLERHPAEAGDAFLLPAGTLHAVGPGMLLYELQQPSDLTYRVDDWGRAATPSRPLHTAEALAAVDVHGRPAVVRHASVGRLATCPQFTLDLVDAAGMTMDPGGRTVQVVTAVAGPVELAGSGWNARLETLASIVVPATAGSYRLSPTPGARALVAALP